MFQANRYITRGIKEQVPIEIQIILWSMIDRLKEDKEIQLDYLQVFELEPVKLGGSWNVQRIVHRQELPPYEKTIHISLVNNTKAKVFVIDGVGDDGKTLVATMMLAEEY